MVKKACKTIQYLSKITDGNNQNDIDLIYYPIAKTETLMENNDEDAEDKLSKHIESVKNINFTF